MNRRIKITTLILAIAMVLPLLCACDIVGGGGKGAADALPEIPGTKSEITKEAAVELYDELMSYGSGAGVPNYQSIASQVKKSTSYQTAVTADKYVQYIAECERSYFENGGSVSLDDGTSATIFFGENDGEMLLVVYKDGVMYVVLLEIELPKEEPPVWPSDEEFAKYHISLTQAEGTKLIGVGITTKETETFADFDSLYVDMKNASRSIYESYISKVKSAGYVLEPHGDVWDGQENYVAFKVVGKISFGCEVRIIEGERVTVDFWNETQNIQRDRGVLISDLWQSGTFVVRSEYIHTPENEPEKETVAGDSSSAKGSEKNPTGSYLRVDFMAVSFSERGYLELWNSDLGDIEITRDEMFRLCSSEIFDYQNKKIYTTTNYGGNKMLHHEHELATKEEIEARFRYSIERHVSDRGTTIGSNYSMATNLQKTGNVNVIAGISCTEYTATCVAVDGDNRITWDATFNVWDEYNIALSYRGQRWWSDNTEYYEEYLYVSEDAWVDYALDLPAYGEYSPTFPEEKIKKDLGFDLPEVKGAEGYFVEISNRSETGDSVLLKNIYHVGGLTYEEYIDYRAEIAKLGFTVEDEWVSPYKYRDSDNAKITLSMHYDTEKGEMIFEVVVDENPAVFLPTPGKYTYEYYSVVHGDTTLEVIFYANGDIRITDAYGNEVLYEKIREYTYIHHGREINITRIYNEISSSYGMIINYTEDWGLNRVGTDNLHGMRVVVYESSDGIVKVYVLEKSGLIFKRLDNGEVTQEIVSITDV